MQTTPAGKTPLPGFLVAHTLRLTPPQIKAGEKGVLTLALQIKPGYHIYAHQPGDRFLTATQLRPLPSPGVHFGDVVWPKPTPYKNARVHEGTVTFTLPLRIAAGARPGHRTLRLECMAQGCNATDCYPPARFILTVELTITAPR